MLERGGLSPRVRERAIEAFRVLAEAEAKIHGTSPDHVHFHEVGAVDAIADIVGAALGIEALGIGSIHVSPLPLGSGTVQSAHGPLPVPGTGDRRAAARLRGAARRRRGRDGDADRRRDPPRLRCRLRRPRRRSWPDASATAPARGVSRDRPNVLRVCSTTSAAAVAGPFASDEMLVVETDIDDMSPELYGHVSERPARASAPPT